MIRFTSGRPYSPEEFFNPYFSEVSQKKFTKDFKKTMSRVQRDLIGILSIIEPTVNNFFVLRLEPGRL